MMEYRPKSYLRTEIVDGIQRLAKFHVEMPNGNEAVFVVPLTCIEIAFAQYPEIVRRINSVAKSAA